MTEQELQRAIADEIVLLLEEEQALTDLTNKIKLMLNGRSKQNGKDVPENGHVKRKENGRSQRPEKDSFKSQEVNGSSGRTD